MVSRKSPEKKSRVRNALGTRGVGNAYRMEANFIEQEVAVSERTRVPNANLGGWFLHRVLRSLLKGRRGGR